MARLLNAADYRAAARRRLPRGLFDYIDRGTEDEVALRGLRQSLDAIVLRPSVLAGAAAPDPASVILGQPHAAPLVIAPTALAGIVARDGEIALARAAAATGIPFCVSTQSVTTVEAIRQQVADARLWFQLYFWNDRPASDALVRRAAEAGCDCLVLTADTPVSPKREYNVANGFAVPLRPGIVNLFDIALHPRWALSVLSGFLGGGGLPSYGHYPEGFRRNVLSSDAAQGLALDPGLEWRDLEHLRRIWPGKLVLKGVLCPADADRALNCGADAVVVSAHGARNFDALPPPAAVLPEVVKATGGRMTVIADSGVMRGSDVLKYLALGADAVMIGRLPLWGLAIGGEDGARKILELLVAEMTTGMAFLGAKEVDDLRGRAGFGDARRDMRWALLQNVGLMRDFPFPR